MLVNDHPPDKMNGSLMGHPKSASWTLRFVSYHFGTLVVCLQSPLQYTDDCSHPDWTA